MGVPGNANPLLLVQAAGAAPAGYEITRSLRFNPSDSASLTKTFSATGSQTTYTFSFWLKKTNSSSVYQNILIDNNSTSSQIRINDTTSGFELRFAAAGASAALTTNRKFRDPSAWYHIVCVYDSTNATSSDRMRIYVNGVRETSFLGEQQPTQNLASAFITNGHTYTIGYYASNTALDGYLADVIYLDGIANDPETLGLGEFDADTGVWNPLEYTGSFGTNGFHLDFSDATSTTTIAEDVSGNNNDWTANNISVTAGADNDSLFDSPTNANASSDTGAGGEVSGNYATWNPLTVRQGGSNPMGAFNGNLEFGETTAVASYGSVISTIAPSSGKYYCELTFRGSKSSNFNVDLFGIVPINEWAKDTRVDLHRVLNALTFDSTGSSGLALQGTGGSTNSTSYSSSGWTNTSVVGLAIDFDAPSLVIYVNNVSQGTFPYSMVAGEPYAIFANDWAGTANITAYILNAGQRPFAYTAPTGYQPLTTALLDDPTIADGSTAMDAVLYTGNGTSQTISGLSFSPDYVWLKGRSNSDRHGNYDTVRGATKRLQSSETNAEDTLNGLTAFNSDGFDVGNYADTNGSGNTYVGWCWDGGSSTVSNTDGSITSSVRANTSAGFSIVTYTGSGGATIGHGLGVAPELIIAKSRTTTAGWIVYSSVLGRSGYLQLHATAAAGSATNYWGTADPTSTVFGVYPSGGASNNSGDMVAYCWAPVEGYSAFGSYTGNGSTDGPFVYTGFRSRWIMIKIADTTTANWVVYDTARDTYNVMDSYLTPNLQNAEYTATFNYFDITSNGFKVRNTNTALNYSNATFIWAAFAEHPFKYARAR